MSETDCLQLRKRAAERGETLKTEEWKTGGTCAAFVDWTGVPIAAGADDRLSGSFRCLECGNSDEPFFGVVTSAVGGQRRGICWPLPPFERARGILQATLRHYNPPTHPPSLSVVEAVVRQFRAITRLEATGIEGESRLLALQVAHSPLCSTHVHAHSAVE